MELKPILINASWSRFDQWRLGQAGGSIVNRRGKEMFKFENREQYEKYLQLNEKRPALTS